MNKNVTSILSNCPLCEEHSLHVVGEEDLTIMQCINCGYVSSPKYIGDMETNEEYKKLSKDMKKWSKVFKNRIWIPTMMTLPTGMVYPLDDNDGDMKWGLASKISISENERKNYPDGKGGFFKNRYDTDNVKIYDTFFELMLDLNKKPEEKKINLPKLKKLE